MTAPPPLAAPAPVPLSTQQARPTPKDPAFVCVYGPPGGGKTTDCGYSFPRALFVAAQNALLPIKTQCGWDPDKQTRAATTIMDAQALIKIASDAGLEAIVFDDFSWLAEQTFNYLENKQKLTGFKLFGKIRDVTLDFRDVARNARIHVILNAWEKGPTLKDGMLVRGGPQLPGKLPEHLPAMCDLVLRASQNGMRRPWGGVYRCTLDPSWIMKDRFTVVPAEAPMNLGEILRLAGYQISRHPALAWQEEAIEVFYAAVMPDPTREAEIGRQLYAELQARGHARKHIDWAMRDALDRVALHRAAANAGGPAAFGW